MLPILTPPGWTLDERGIVGGAADAKAVDLREAIEEEPPHARTPRPAVWFGVDGEPMTEMEIDVTPPGWSSEHASDAALVERVTAALRATGKLARDRVTADARFVMVTVPIDDATEEMQRDLRSVAVAVMQGVPV